MAGLSTRPLVRARALRRHRRVPRRLVGGDGRPAAPALPFGPLPRRPARPALRPRRAAGHGRRRTTNGRRRARRGLEILDVLRREAPNRVLVVDDEVPEVDEVDAKLVALAAPAPGPPAHERRQPGARSPSCRACPTVIPRRLAADLIPGVLAGETLHVALTRAGRHPGQGVGFLEDGSMVVVNGGEDLVGAGPMSLVVSSIVPTERGPDGVRPARGSRGRGPRRRPTAGRGRRRPRPRRGDVRDGRAVGPVLTGADVWADRRRGRIRGALRRAQAVPTARRPPHRRPRGATPPRRVRHRRAGRAARRRGLGRPAGVRRGRRWRDARRRRCGPAWPRCRRRREIVVVHDAARPLADAALFDARDRRGARRRRRRGARGADRRHDRSGSTGRPRRRDRSPRRAGRGADAAGVPRPRCCAPRTPATPDGTDDAALVEAAGRHGSWWSPASPDNLKVTGPGRPGAGRGDARADGSRR